MQKCYVFTGEFHDAPLSYGKAVYLAADVDAREAQGTAVIKAQRDRIAALEQRVDALQRALYFWLPGVPEEAHALHERIAGDAMLLYGLDAPDLKQDAHDLGWITLNATAQGKFSGESNG